MDALTARYCKEKPSAQTILDIFDGEWKSAIPAELGLRTGAISTFFRDPRVLWAAGSLPGGFKGMDILELGPFEGYDSYLFESMGAKVVTSVEANNINFLKCLVLKEALHLKTKLLHGDFRKFLAKDSFFDLIWASGVLYHSDDPIDLLDRIMASTNNVFIWTHYYADDMDPAQKARFKDAVPREIEGMTFSTHPRPYFSAGTPGRIPLNYEGGTEEVCFWMNKPDILGFFEKRGFTVSIHEEGALAAGPCIGFLARKV